MKIRSWIWKWHFIAGLISLPFILLLSVTGIIYLFKADYETPIHRSIKNVAILSESSLFQEQWDIASAYALKKPHSMMVPQTPNEATEFISGKFGGKRSIFIDPYKKEVSGEVIVKNGFMYTVRKLHGELLMGSFGTKIVELIASWMVVLIVTGLYIWWPSRGFRLSGFFIPRFKNGRRMFFRDVHAIGGFWISLLLLLVLAGGFPWTDVFGSNFKRLQKMTNTGYPLTWNGKGLASQEKNTDPLPLDQVVSLASKMSLEGRVQIHFPKNKKGTYAVSNSTPDLDKQKKIHLDQYTGETIKIHHWKDVGILMRARMWLMVFHQGEFGLWNWLLMLGTGIVLFLMSFSALMSYIFRKSRGSWGVPRVPEHFKIDYPIFFIIVVLGIVFPLFGISLVLLSMGSYLLKKRNSKRSISGT